MRNFLLLRIPMDIMPNQSESPSPRVPEHTPSSCNTRSDTPQEVPEFGNLLSVVDQDLNRPTASQVEPDKATIELDELIQKTYATLEKDCAQALHVPDKTPLQALYENPDKARHDRIHAIFQEINYLTQTPPAANLSFEELHQSFEELHQCNKLIDSIFQEFNNLEKREKREKRLRARPQNNQEKDKASCELDNLFDNLHQDLSHSIRQHPIYATAHSAIEYDEPLPKDYDTHNDNAPHVVAMRNHPALSSQYHIVRELGHGAQGTTWLARFKANDRYVAIKALSFESITQWKSTELFMREIETLKSMRIKGTPQYIDAIDASTCDKPYYFLVQTLVPGKTLEDMLQEGYVFSPEDTSAIALAILPILNKMHTLVPPIIHRDIKPSNIMLTPSGNIYLIDFGASMLHERALGGTTVAGTAGYMAPEQCLGSSRPESDIYSLGATLVHLLTGKPPWQLTVTSNMRLLFKSNLPFNTPAELSQLLEAMLDPMPDKRLSNLPRLMHFLNEYGMNKKSRFFAESVQKNEKIKSEDELSIISKDEFSLFPLWEIPLFKYSNAFHMAWGFSLFFLFYFTLRESDAFACSFLPAFAMVLIYILVNIAILFIYTYFYKKLLLKNKIKNAKNRT